MSGGDRDQLQHELRARAESLLRRGRPHAEVVPVLERLRAEAADGSEAQLFASRHLAEALLEADPWRAALHLRHVLAHRRDDDVAHALMGLAQALLGHFRAAVSAYRRALQLAPRNPWYHHNVGHLLDVALGDRASALPHLRTAHRLEPAEDEITASLAHCLAGVGALDEARALADEAVRLAPKNKDHRALLAWIDAGARAEDGPHAAALGRHSATIAGPASSTRAGKSSATKSSATKSSAAKSRAARPRDGRQPSAGPSASRPSAAGLRSDGASAGVASAARPARTRRGHGLRGEGPAPVEAPAPRRAEVGLRARRRGARPAAAAATPTAGAPATPVVGDPASSDRAGPVRDVGGEVVALLERNMPAAGYTPGAVRTARTIFGDYAVATQLGAARRDAVQPAFLAAAVECALVTLYPKLGISPAQIARRYGVNSRSLLARAAKIASTLALRPGHPRY
jgi:tetratricopeptide (TPR) repeat protein